MSYVVTIKRLEGAPITPAEFRALAVADSSFHLSAPDDSHELVEADWLPPLGKSPVAFSLYRGEISVTTPSDEALRKMQDLAASLHAVVVGEEGENLTDVSLPSVGEGGCGVPMLVILSFVALLALYWVTR